MPSQVPLRSLGKNGPKVPALGTGMMGLSHFVYGTVPSDEEKFKVLDKAYELGARFWDSADLYGENEALIGQWFKRTGKRDEIFLATKFGFVKGDKTLKVDSSAEYCKKACEESLKCLGVDYIDLYYVHSVQPDTPIEETMRALAQLQAEGKIKHIGLSSISSSTLRRAVKIAPVACVQTEYSVFDQAIEGPKGTDLLATCRELGIALVIATPLGRGILTNSFTSSNFLSDPADVRPKMMPRFQGDNLPANIEMVTKFKTLADKKGCTVAQLALAWLLKQGDDIIPIPGTKKIERLEENWKTLDMVLSDEEEKEIRSLMGGNKISGGSVPEKYEGYLFKDTREEVA